MVCTSAPCVILFFSVYALFSDSSWLLFIMFTCGIVLSIIYCVVYMVSAFAILYVANMIIIMFICLIMIMLLIL